MMLRFAELRMTSNRLRLLRSAGIFGLGAIVASGVLFVARARAAGIPDADALTYTGYLEDPDGTPVSGTKGIGISLYDAAAKGAEVCRQNVMDFELVAGRFQILLPDTCTTAVKANPNLWVEIQVEGALLGRSKLGAVPYSLEAAHASAADAAKTADAATVADTAKAASGALKDTLTALQSQVHPASAFSAYLSAATSIPNATGTPLVFNQVEFDSGDEYAKATGVFKAKLAGVYVAVCAVEYSPTVATALYQATILKNGLRIGLTEVSAGGTNGITPEHTVVTQLAANDTLICWTGQYSGASAAVHVAEKLTHFSVARLY
jgi:hypothetical protein